MPFFSHLQHTGLFNSEGNSLRDSYLPQFTFKIILNFGELETGSIQHQYMLQMAMYY